MRSTVGLIVACGYLVLVVALLAGWVLLLTVVDDFPMWQNVGDALFVVVLPWSIVSFFTIWIDKQLLTDVVFVAVHVVGGLINAGIIYMVCAFLSYWIRKLTQRDSSAL